MIIIRHLKVSIIYIEIMNSTNMKEKNIIRIIKNEEKFHEYSRNQYHSSTNKEKIKNLSWKYNKAKFKTLSRNCYEKLSQEEKYVKINSAKVWYLKRIMKYKKWVKIFHKKI